MQPLSLGARPERDERVFQVTNKGLGMIVDRLFSVLDLIYVLLIIREIGRDRFMVSECTK